MKMPQEGLAFRLRTLLVTAPGVNISLTLAGISSLFLPHRSAFDVVLVLNLQKNAAGGTRTPMVLPARF